ANGTGSVTGYPRKRNGSTRRAVRWRAQKERIQVIRAISRGAKNTSAGARTLRRRALAGHRPFPIFPPELAHLAFGICRVMFSSGRCLNGEATGRKWNLLTLTGQRMGARIKKAVERG